MSGEEEGAAAGGEYLTKCYNFILEEGGLVLHDGRWNSGAPNDDS